MLSGTAVRLRFFSRWGIGVEDLSRIVVFNSITFWLGILVLGGTSLALDPLPAVAPSAATVSSVWWAVFFWR